MSCTNIKAFFITFSAYFFKRFFTCETSVTLSCTLAALVSCAGTEPAEIAADNVANVSDTTETTYVTREIDCENNGQRIFGMAYIPQGVDGKMPAVIYSHGLGSWYSYAEPYTRFLASHGIACYAFDFRGGSPSSRSEGSTLQMSIFTEESDLEQVLHMVRDWELVDEDRVFLFGSSQGGMVSAMVAADHEAEVAGLMLFYPAFCIQEFALSDYSSPQQVPATRMFLGMTVGRAYFEGLFDYDTYADIKRYDKDVLIVHGNRDSVVPLSFSRRAASEYPSATLKVIDNAGHGFSGNDINEAAGYIWEYLLAHT